MVLVLGATFTQPPIDALFTNPDHMNLSALTRDALILDGIGSPVDIHVFQK